MPSDAWSPSPAKQPQSLEALKQAFKQKLELVLNKQLTVDNIESFADEALSDTILLTDDILTAYMNSPEAEKGLSKKEEEDKAFEFFGVQNINEILDSINEVKDSIGKLKEYLNTKIENTDTVITPPQEVVRIEATGEGAESFEKKMFPRMLTLLYILEHDFEIPAEEVKITKGAVTPDMVRKTPYMRVEISDLKRVVYICDEAGNASYVFDTEKLKENGLIIENLDLEDKGEKNALISTYLGVGIRIVQTKNWRSRISAVLEGEILVAQVETSEVKPTSEFKGKKELLPFDKFQAEARALYPGGSIEDWYPTERRKHPDWPSNPQTAYKNVGWEGWIRLVEKFLSFEDLQLEVRSVYKKNGTGNAHLWYMEEYKKHPRWPSSPDSVYPKGEWISWSDLVGQDNQRNKEFLYFDKFQEEVRALYPGKGDVGEWYKKERVISNKEKIWPFSPDRIYKHNGWIGWSELVGRDNHLKREFLSFNDFKKEVTGLCPKGVNLRNWYKQEYKKYKHWPASPDQVYKHKGWISWPEMAGVRNS